MGIQGGIVLNAAGHGDAGVDQLRERARNWLASEGRGVRHCFAETVLRLVHVHRVDPGLL